MKTYGCLPTYIAKCHHNSNTLVEFCNTLSHRYCPALNISKQSLYKEIVKEVCFKNSKQNIVQKHCLCTETCCSHYSQIVTVRLLGPHWHRVDIKIHGPGQPEILWQPVLPSLENKSFFWMQLQVHWLVLSCDYARPAGCNCVSEQPNKERSKYSRPLAIHDWTYSSTIVRQYTE